MPEKTVLKLFEREVGWEERRIPSTVDRTDDTSFIGADFSVVLGFC